MSSAYHYNATTQIFFFFFFLSYFANSLTQLQMYANNQFPHIFCDSLSVQPDLGYQEKYDLKVPSTEHEVRSVWIRGIKHTPATYTMINFHSNSKN
jgi:hypothetical protein